MLIYHLRSTIICIDINFIKSPSLPAVFDGFLVIPFTSCSILCHFLPFLVDFPAFPRIPGNVPGIPGNVPGNLGNVPGIQGNAPGNPGIPGKRSPEFLLIHSGGLSVFRNAGSAKVYVKLLVVPISVESQKFQQRFQQRF